jgi:glycosyltransferase involved in cell wall biosynthesis
MTVAEPSLSDAARIVRRAVTGRRRATGDLPRFRVADGPRTNPPTVWMVTPHFDRPAGGVRKLYRAVDVLNEAGIPAVVVHQRPGFRCTWFEHSTPIVAGGEVLVWPGDVIAIPEVYNHWILDLPAGISRVIYNQGAYMALDRIVAGGPEGAAAYRENPELAAVVVVSEDSAATLEYAFPGLPIRRIRHAIDPALHHPPAEPPGRRIAYMPRRRETEVAQVLRLLELRGVVEDWELVPIAGRSEREAADLLRSSSIFLAFGEREGFGLPALEALACGCHVVGFDGFGGRELFQPPFAVSVENGDVIAFARAVEAAVRRMDEDPAAMAAAADAGVRFVREQYSSAAERQTLVEAFAPLLGS